MSVKQVIVIRKDLKMRRGKEIAQGAHASMKWLVERVKEMENEIAEYEARGHDWARKPLPGIQLTEDEHRWIYGNFRKVTLQVQSEAELDAIYKNALDAGLEVHMVVDSGLTEFNNVPTKTAIAIGPDEDQYIDKVTGSLELY